MPIKIGMETERMSERERALKAISKQYNFTKDRRNIIIDRFPKCGQRLWFFCDPSHTLSNMSTCEFAKAPYGSTFFFLQSQAEYARAFNKIDE